MFFNYFKIDNINRMTSGIVCSVISVFAPVKTLLIIVLVFIAIDFITGVWASYHRAKRNKEAFKFSSEKMWRTVNKLVLALGGVMLAHLLDVYILEMQTGFNVAKMFTGFICGCEFISYLENAGDVSRHPTFRKFEKIVKKDMRNQIDKIEQNITKNE